jgi:hypothetical protein
MPGIFCRVGRIAPESFAASLRGDAANSSKTALFDIIQALTRLFSPSNLQALNQPGALRQKTGKRRIARKFLQAVLAAICGS